MTRVIHCSKSIYTGRRLKAARILATLMARRYVRTIEFESPTKNVTSVTILRSVVK